MAIDNELIDKLLKDYKKPEDLVGENGLLKELTKRLLERAMSAEMTGRLSIMLCLRGSSSLFETGLEHGIQLRKRGKGGACAGSPAAIFQ